MDTFTSGQPPSRPSRLLRQQPCHWHPSLSTHLVEAADAVVHIAPEQALRQVLVLDHRQLERVALQPRVVVSAGRGEGEEAVPYHAVHVKSNWRGEAGQARMRATGAWQALFEAGSHVWIARPMPSITTAG